jgi:signal transduction histidine kinase
MDGPCPRRCDRGGGPSFLLRLRLRSVLARGWPITALPALTACSDGAAAGGPWIFGAVALLLVASAAYGVGTVRTRQRLEAELRTAHRETQTAIELLDTWAWQSDAQHRLLRLHPPAGASADEWQRHAGEGATLWERFESATPADVAGLRARLESQVPFGDLRVRLISDGSRWLLRAAPRFDEQGRFAGYSGSARPTAEHDALNADQGALHALLAATASPALLAVGDGRAAGWTLSHANPAAQSWLDKPDAQWGDVLAQLPAVVRDAVPAVDLEAAGSGTGSGTRTDTQADASEADGWLLRRFTTEAGPGLLLLKAPQADAEAGAGEGVSFGYTVSHDLRAPIRVVEGFTRILKEDYGRQLDRVGNDHLDRVLGAAARMNHMIDALMTLAKLSQQPLARQPVNLSQLAAYVVDDLRRAAPERNAEIEIEPGLQTRGDPTLLRLVLENLLGNAWKYTARVKKARIVLATEVHDGRRAYVVRDNGAGFDMRSADRLFGLFQRLHSANDFPGNGVGLASVKRIVRRHGGEVWADAEPGRGAAFYFTLRD